MTASWLTDALFASDLFYVAAINNIQQYSEAASCGRTESVHNSTSS